MKPPHQITLVIWTMDGGDSAVLDALNPALIALAGAGAVHQSTDPTDDTDKGWYWSGAKGVES